MNRVTHELITSSHSFIYSGNDYTFTDTLREKIHDQTHATLMHNWTQLNSLGHNPLRCCSAAIFSNVPQYKRNDNSAGKNATAIE